MEDVELEEDDNASTCASTTGAFDDGIDESYIVDLTIVEKKWCKACHHSSDELNPLTRGKHARSAKWPCWPWWQGTCIRPTGLVCRLCTFTFVVGNFCLEFGSLDDLVPAMKTPTAKTLFDEFVTCQKKTDQPHQ